MDLNLVCLRSLSEQANAPPPPPTCPQLFLGPDIGFQTIMSYHDEDHTCHIDMAELGRVCQHFFDECLAL